MRTLLARRGGIPFLPTIPPPILEVKRELRVLGTTISWKRTSEAQGRFYGWGIPRSRDRPGAGVTPKPVTMFSTHPEVEAIGRPVLLPTSRQCDDDEMMQADPVTMTTAIVGAVIGSLGLILGIVNHVRDLRRHSHEMTEKRSQFHLDACVRGYAEARKLLQDGNNDRRTWIQAARALTHAKSLSSGVTVDWHRRLLELHKLDYRGFFHRALAEKTPAFFYGSRDSSVSITDAAADSSASEERGGRLVVSTVRELSPPSIYVIWEAAKWPEDYDDPLDREFTAKEEGQLLVLFP